MRLSVSAVGRAPSLPWLGWAWFKVGFFGFPYNSLMGFKKPDAYHHFLSAAKPLQLGGLWYDFNNIRLIDVVHHAVDVQLNPKSGSLGYYATQLPVSEPNPNGLIHKFTVEAV
jgi:hypothetical protein